MKKLRRLILIFSCAISLPLAFVIWQTYSGLQQEEQAQFRFFAETLFDQMEKELAEFIQQEESRAVDAYGYYVGNDKNRRSALSYGDYPSFILGYLQNNPDGSFLIPSVADMDKVPGEMQEHVAAINEVNRLFNGKKWSISQIPSRKKKLEDEVRTADRDDVQMGALSERYLKSPQKTQPDDYLGKKRQRVEQITLEQAYNVAKEDQVLQQYRQKQKVTAPSPLKFQEGETVEQEKRSISAVPQLQQSSLPSEEYEDEGAGLAGSADTFDVEVAPYQSVSIDNNKVYVFRRIVINSQIYRQGFVLLVDTLTHHLTKTHFSSQPMAAFSSLQIKRNDLVQKRGHIDNNAGAGVGGLKVDRQFPAPFNFLHVSLSSDNVPSSPARNPLNIAIVLLGLFLLSGLFLLYQSVRSIVALSERRSQFVSSVTHELKTPLTNIRLYVEMLEQGIAATPEKEQEYLAILGGESSRLSGLINNVLELSKLEKKSRRFNLQPGNLDDVLDEIEAIMSAKLQQEDFLLTIEKHDIPEFGYDREVVLQILMNLVENSMKFGKKSAKKEIVIKADRRDSNIRIQVADSGPGIPKRSLRKVFDDFYRVENDLTRSTGGTGIGLALVKKFVNALGGEVAAENNADCGCTITISLPMQTF